MPAFAVLPADSPAWRALLHFESKASSVEEHSSFFLSSERTPESEWQATSLLFAHNPEAVCRFPARAIFFGLKPSGTGALCERWETWRRAVSAKGIELVFASSFINSPSSMYGHTLLKFPRGGKTEGEELLDYTLNYGAETGGSAGAAYVWLGLTGGFRGYYATAPFYLKVKEYNFVENRDFWIYPLNVSPPELELLVAHAWELREIGFPYFFLRKNCSYYLLEFLEVARPGQGLTDSFPLWAVPMDTIRRLSEKGWLGEPRLRPSRHKRLASRKKQLLPGEAGIVSQLLENPDLDLPVGREGLLLDTAYELSRYKTEGKKESVSSESALLARRGKFGPVERRPIVELSPDKGHRTGRLGIGYGLDRRAHFGEITYRGALQDVLDAPLGFEPSSELSMGDLRFRFEKKKFFAERIDVLRIRSLAPLERWFPGKAWSFRVGYARAKEMFCADWKCGHGLINGGAGIAWRLGPVQFFTLAEVDLEAGGVFTPDYRLAAGPTGGVFTPLWRGARILAEGEWRLRLLGERRQKRSARFGLNQDLGGFELRVETAVDRGAREALLKLNHFF